MSKGKEQVVPFHRAAVGEQEAQAAADVVRSGWITMGSRTIEFEEKFAAYVGAKHAIGVCSGTAGLHLALDAIGLKQGEEVLVPTTTFTASAEVVVYFKAKPVLVDVDAASLCIDPADACFLPRSSRGRHQRTDGFQFLCHQAYYYRRRRHGDHR
jgi:perosamine synthetase